MGFWLKHILMFGREEIEEVINDIAYGWRSREVKVCDSCS
jgi:hypothetical protein